MGVSRFSPGGDTGSMVYHFCSWWSVPFKKVGLINWTEVFVTFNVSHLCEVYGILLALRTCNRHVLLGEGVIYCDCKRKSSIS